MKRGGKTTAVTAVYAHHEANNDMIVFSDKANATRTIEKKSENGYATTDGNVSADTVFYDLANRGGHPIELTIMDPSSDGSHTVVDLSMLEGKNKSATHFSASDVKLEIVRRDDERIEGKATYDDGKISMSLPFAIDKNRVGHAKAAATNIPPPPPPPSSAGAMLILAADLLKLEIGEYYGKHGNTWPSSIEQVHKIDYVSQEAVASRALGPNGVLTIMFVPNAPFVGGKTVTFTPTPDAEGGVQWSCSAPGLKDVCE